MDVGLDGEEARVSQGLIWNLSCTLRISSLGACAYAQASPAGQATVSCEAERAQTSGGQLLGALLKEDGRASVVDTPKYAHCSCPEDVLCALADRPAGMMQRAMGALSTPTETTAQLHACMHAGAVLATATALSTVSTPSAAALWTAIMGNTLPRSMSG